MRTTLLYLSCTLALCLLCALLLPSVPAAAQSAGQAGANPFAAARERTAGLTIYRLTFTVRARGTMADPQTRTPPADLVTLEEFAGVFVGQDVGLNYRTVDAIPLGLDRQRGLELLVVRGVTYALGPLPVSGATETRWYNLGKRPPPIQPPLQIRPALDRLAGQVDPARLRRLRFEQLDSKRCAVYRGGAPAVSAALIGVGRSITGERDRSVEQQLRALRLERAEYLAWVCDDGYIRQIQVTASGFQPSRPARRFGVEIQLRIQDIGSRTLRIGAPGDALVLPPTPTLNGIVAASGDIRQAPADDAPALAQVRAREMVQLLDRTEDSR
ncbi:MAG TPA: hypothetical protein VNL77_19825, partial [Roseiflexaceae bacterium]|nr:hypothetical protein [Roseiflexaceae bacterium]